MAEITVLKLPLQRQLMAALYRHDFVEMKRIYYTLYPDDPGAKEWLEEQEKGLNQSSAAIAYAKSVITSLAEEAEREAREFLNGKLSDYSKGYMAQHAAAWLRQKAEER